MKFFNELQQFLKTFNIKFGLAILLIIFKNGLIFAYFQRIILNNKLNKSFMKYLQLSVKTAYQRNNDGDHFCLHLHFNFGLSNYLHAYMYIKSI